MSQAWHLIQLDVSEVEMRRAMGEGGGRTPLAISVTGLPPRGLSGLSCVSVFSPWNLNHVLASLALGAILWQFESNPYIPADTDWASAQAAAT